MQNSLPSTQRACDDQSACQLEFESGHNNLTTQQSMESIARNIEKNGNNDEAANDNGTLDTSDFCNNHRTSESTGFGVVGDTRVERDNQDENSITAKQGPKTVSKRRCFQVISRVST